MTLSSLRKSHVFLVCCLFLINVALSLKTDETEARAFIDDLAESYSYECNLEMVARWAYITDVENETAEAETNEADQRYFTFQAEAAKDVSEFDYRNFDDVELYREFRFQAPQGPGGLDQENLTLYTELQSNMETIYSTATICSYSDPEDCTLTLEPDLEEIMATSTDWEELTYVWEQWRNVTGPLMRDDYVQFVALSNQAAMIDGYADTSQYWLDGYTVTQKEADGYGTDGNLVAITQDQFKLLVRDVWEDVFESLYKPLHAWVRMKLKDVYPQYIDLEGTIPANILGNMWAQDWTNVAEYVMPFEDQPDFDVTESMVENGWDIDQMFDSAEDFFTSLGLYPMTDDFWEKSVVNQSDWEASGKVMLCHASAEDFCLGAGSTDFRIKMCTEVNMGDLVTVHHEMGHIEYFMAYRDQPHVFRDAANPGFHEAIGDLIALSVSTPQHMEEVLNLTSSVSKGVTSSGSKSVTSSESDYTDDEKRDLNFLMRMALEKIAFLPFGYLIDKYRWGIFDGSIDSEHLNSQWWNLREDYQGVSPPSNRSRGEKYFDPGAKYHVPANVPYIRYFVSFIVQFQFHQQLCSASGYEGPLYSCDIYSSQEAGDILGDVLQKGLSEPWPLVLEELGGSLSMDASAIKEYFQPLMDFLNTELEAAGQMIGWNVHRRILNDDSAWLHLKLVERNITPYAVASVDAAWAYNTNMTDENAEAMNDASVEFSSMYQSFWNELFSQYYYEDITSPSIKRQYAMQQTIGTAILNEEDLSELNSHITAMVEDYSNKVCPFDDMKCDEAKEGYDIDKLEQVMAENKDYSQLLYYWEEWRDASGKEMIDDYEQYVVLMNKAAELNGFDDAGDMWVEPYTTYGEDLYTETDFKSDIEFLWESLKDYYAKLHAFVRFKLKQREDYEKYFDDDDLIPAHILGNMWAQSWENIYDFVAPYPEVPLLDISDALEQENNVTTMFEIAEDFFLSLEMFPMTDDFWENSLFVQPPDRQVVCHASAWDFYSTEGDVQEDGRFRIKMCTNTNQEDFIVIHHEMGHTQYQMAYSDLPLIFRDGANPGFHEAIGDTIALSVSTPSHLQLISSYLNQTEEEIFANFNRVKNIEYGREDPEEPTDDEKRDINFLMKQALAKIAFLPYAYILDQWRWEVFAGDVDQEIYNKRWWELRIDYQGLRPPISRSAMDDFDIGAKYHVPSSVPYIRYFVSYILQFQFHEKLCNISGNTDPLYNCDIYGHTEAGSALLSLLSAGASEHWQDQLSAFLETPDGDMNATSLINYFDPLWVYLDEQIELNNLEPGWASSNDVIDDYIKENETISAVVPIVVGVVLAVLVCIVLVAFFVGQKRRKKMENKAEIVQEKKEEIMHDKDEERKEEREEKGETNEGLEMDEKEEKDLV